MVYLCKQTIPAVIIASDITKATAITKTMYTSEKYNQNIHFETFIQFWNPMNINMSRKSDISNAYPNKRVYIPRVNNDDFGPSSIAMASAIA